MEAWKQRRRFVRTPNSWVFGFGSLQLQWITNKRSNSSVCKRVFFYETLPPLLGLEAIAIGSFAYSSVLLITVGSVGVFHELFQATKPLFQKKSVAQPKDLPVGTRWEREEKHTASRHLWGKTCKETTTQPEGLPSLVFFGDLARMTFLAHHLHPMSIHSNKDASRGSWHRYERSKDASRGSWPSY